MNYIKIGLWIFLLAVLYAAGVIEIFGVYPEFLFLFAVLYSIMAKSFSERVAVAVVCGILMSALGGFGFVFSMLLVSYSALFFGLVFRGKIKEHFIFVPIMVFLVTFLYEGVFGMVVNGITEETLKTVLRATVLNCVASVVLYPLIKKTFEERERYIF